MRVDFQADTGARREEIAEGITIELPASALFDDVEIEGEPHRVTMRLELTTEGIRPTSVTVDGQSRPVSGTTLRAVRVWDLAEQAIRLGLDRTSGAPTVLSSKKAAQLRASGPQTETLEWVAFFYNLGHAIGLAPARKVELELGVPRTTASKWVRRAREAGLIHEPAGVDEDNLATGLSVADAAARLGVSAKAVFSLVHSGEIPAMRVGKSFRIAEHDIQAYQRQQREVG